MNKKLFLRLGVLLLSLSLVSCGPKDNFSKTNSNKSNNKTQSSIKKEENNIKQGTAPDVKEENKVNKNTNPPELFIVAGGSNKVPGVCEYYLSELEVTPRIKPSINTKNSSYYDEKNQDNIYVDVVFDVYNLSNEAKMADDIITTKIKIKNNEYSCFSLVESTDGSDLEKSP